MFKCKNVLLKKWDFNGLEIFDGTANVFVSSKISFFWYLLNLNVIKIMLIIVVRSPWIVFDFIIC